MLSIKRNSKMEYANNTSAKQTIEAVYAAAVEDKLPDNYVDEKSINCNVTTASPIDLLYSPYIRGGRKMVSSCGCGGMTGGMTGGNGGSGGGGSIGSSGGNGGSEEGSTGIIGGCFSCKKGVKNITFIYNSIHIIIPRLYNKYKANSVSSPDKIMEIAKVSKATKVATKPFKPAKAARATKAKAARAIKKS